MIRRTAIALAAAGALALAVMGTASAKQEQFLIPLDCGADGQFTVIGIPGNGTWTPGPLVGGGIIIPTAFTNQHGTFTDNEGHVFTENDPDVFKRNSGPAKKTHVTCTFTVSFSDENGSGTFTGTVQGFLNGR